jgi:choline-sulfatase
MRTMSARKQHKRRARSEARAGSSSHAPVLGRGHLLAALAVVAIVAVGVLLWPKWQAGRAALHLAPGAARGFNVLLVTLDTTRSDHLGCYGSRVSPTLTLDGLASQGARVLDAVSPVPMTLPAHASIMTGDYPPRHGVRNNGTYRLADDQKTLAERLKAEGYDTAAFVGAFVLDRRYGLAQGFDEYEDRFGKDPAAPPGVQLNPERRADRVADAFLAWLAREKPAAPGRRFFAWVHFYDPHAPYRPPEPFRSANPYDGELAFMDQQVGRVIEGLRARQALDNTLIVLVGDHGEGLGEHGESTHSLLVYEATMRVPLILYAPRLIRGPALVADRVVSIVDVAPTILDCLGLPSDGCDGVSFLRPPVRDRALYMESLAPQLDHGWSPLFAVREGEMKYVKAPTPELYDLADDPHELHDLYKEKRQDAGRLAARLDSLAVAMAGGETGSEIAMDAEARRKLEALGYISSAPEGGGGELLDPKRMIARTDERLRQASELMNGRRFEEAVPLLKTLLSNSPEDAGLWSMLSMAQGQTGRTDDAIAARMKAIDLQPQDAGGWVALADLQFSKGDREAAEKSLAEAQRIEPELGAIYITRAKEAMREERYQEALTLAEEAGRRDPSRYRSLSWIVRARVYENMGRAAQARAAYDSAGVRPPEPESP